MEATLSKNIKRVSISSKRQITIPQKFYTMLGFASEAECIVNKNELIIRPVKPDNGGDFAEQILEDLINQGYSGDELLAEFKKRQAGIRHAVTDLLSEAKDAANGSTQSMTVEDVFGED